MKCIQSEDDILLTLTKLKKGMAQLDAKSSGRMGSRALLYYLGTTILAAIVGIIMVVAIHPGDVSIKQDVIVEASTLPVSTMDALLDIARNMFPDNLVQACKLPIVQIFLFTNKCN